MKKWWRQVRPGLLAAPIFWLVYPLVKSLRVTIVNREYLDDSGQGKIACMWHGRTVIPAFGRFWKNFWVMISLSRDGEMQARIYKRIGFSIIRGSTGRGGARAAAESVSVLKNGGKMAITPDGPKGPHEVVQSGVLFLARKSGAGLYPMGVACRPCILAPSWDRYLVPVPFAKAAIVMGEPIYLSKDATPEEEERVRQALENAIKIAQERAERLAGYRKAKSAADRR